MATSRGLPALAVGFSPPESLHRVAEHLGWRGPFLADEDRVLYRALELGRAPWWRVYSPATLAIYARGWRHRPRATTRVREDTRQLGGDAVVHDGVVRVLWSPGSPDDRVGPRELADTARALPPPGASPHDATPHDATPHPARRRGRRR